MVRDVASSKVSSRRLVSLCLSRRLARDRRRAGGSFVGRRPDCCGSLEKTAAKTGTGNLFPSNWIAVRHDEDRRSVEGR